MQSVGTIMTYDYSSYGVYIHCGCDTHYILEPKSGVSCQGSVVIRENSLLFQLCKQC